MTGAKSPGLGALSMVNPGAAAIDIGSTMHMAAINPQADGNPVRAFGTFTGDLHDMARWFRASGVTSVAMESTGVYWIPAYEVLEAHGFHVMLSTRVTPRTSRAERPMSAMQPGCNASTAMGCCGGASDPRQAWRPCVPISGSASG